MPRVSSEEAKLFSTMYSQGSSVTQIAREYGRSTSTVWSWLRRLDVPIRSVEEGWKLAKDEGRIPEPPNTRKWFCDENTFEDIDEPTAWLLGLIVGDGYVVPATGRFLLACGRDEDLAHKAKAILKWTGSPVKRNNCWMVELCSKPLVQSLVDLGITQAKTYTVELPEVEEDLYPHLIRGCWEADGTMSVLKNKNLFVKYTSASSVLLHDVRDKVVEGAEVSVPQIQRRRPGDRSMSISWGTNSARKVADWLYESSEETMRSERKTSLWKGGQ